MVIQCHLDCQQYGRGEIRVVLWSGMDPSVLFTVACLLNTRPSSFCPHSLFSPLLYPRSNFASPCAGKGSLDFSRSMDLKLKRGTSFMARSQIRPSRTIIFLSTLFHTLKNRLPPPDRAIRWPSVSRQCNNLHVRPS